MEKIKNNKGVTLVALVVTIIVLMSVALIAVNSGKENISKAKLEQIKTNMLLIQAKAKESVEEANFKMGINPNDEKKAEVRNEVYVQQVGLKPAKDVEMQDIPYSIESIKEQSYIVTDEVLEKWGLNKIERETNEYYLVKFDETNVKVEVYNTLGYEEKYSLTEIENIHL